MHNISPHLTQSMMQGAAPDLLHSSFVVLMPDPQQSPHPCKGQFLARDTDVHNKSVIRWFYREGTV